MAESVRGCGLHPGSSHPPSTDAGASFLDNGWGMLSVGLMALIHASRRRQAGGLGKHDETVVQPPNLLSSSYNCAVRSIEVVKTVTIGSIKQPLSFPRAATTAPSLSLLLFA